ncbi:hypothetical protein [Methylophaga sp.]|jgi:hypothetical protein|uniref:hypothetical protein n=1 Tax=Methylophaga sp. TaxID=2024840 RepID=UPI001401AC3E|nr:hypothetical protein [Methylophaga sp.]MTI64536.1 hypothetical protein [Methylophaga sp.]
MSKQLAPYPEKLARCMVNYQFLEEGLRFCLYRCHTLIQLRILSSLPYEVPLKTIDESSLPRLIELFKPFSRNESLIQKLRLVNNHRDSLAHDGGLIQTGDNKAENEKAQEAFLVEAEECAAMIKEEAVFIDQQLIQEYRRLKQSNALPEIDIIPPL